MMAESKGSSTLLLKNTHLEFSLSPWPWSPQSQDSHFAVCVQGLPSSHRLCQSPLGPPPQCSQTVPKFPCLLDQQCNSACWCWLHLVFDHLGSPFVTSQFCEAIFWNKGAGLCLGGSLPPSWANQLKLQLVLMSVLCWSIIGVNSDLFFFSTS